MSEGMERKPGEVISTDNQNLSVDQLFKETQYFYTNSIMDGEIPEFQLYILTNAPIRSKRLAKKNDNIYPTVRSILVVSTDFSVIEIYTILA